jgi:hypothetical protein
VCFSRAPITPARPGGKIVFNALRNIRTGRPIGASQVTAIVEQRRTSAEEALTYDVAIRAELVYPYFVRLQQPVVLPASANRDPMNQEWTRTTFEFVRRMYAKPATPRNLSMQVEF